MSELMTHNDAYGSIVQISGKKTLIILNMLLEYVNVYNNDVIEKLSSILSYLLGIVFVEKWLLQYPCRKCWKQKIKYVKLRR